jgi:hypothetical protein
VIFAGVTPAAYDFYITRVAPAEILPGLATLRRLRADGWDVEALGADDGSSFVLLALRYIEDPSPQEGR